MSNVKAVLLSIAALAAGCGDGESPTATAPSGSIPVTTTTPGETAERAAPPAPFTIEGRGPTTRSVTVPNDYRPVIIVARFPNRSILTVQLRGGGLDRVKGNRGGFLFDMSPSATATPGIASGITSSP
jgi:hypothetical protein